MFLRFNIHVAADFREPVTAVLYGHGCEGIEERDDALIAYFPDSVNTDEIRAALSQFEGLTLTQEAVEERDWQAEWKERFECVREAGLLICPPWKVQEPGPGEKLMLLDPGNAFGAGDHVTTLTVLRLLKEWADRRENLKENLNAESLLDLGTGTGILAIGANMMGIGDITAVDTDISSVEAAEKNFALNGLTGKARVLPGSIGEAVAGRPAGIGYDVILANIFQEPLLALMHSIASALNPGGTLIISGLLDGQQKAVLDEADRHGLFIEDSVIEKGWFSGILIRAK